MKLLLAVSSLASIITLSPVVYQAGVLSSAKLLATKSPLDYDSINVNYDLRLLYGDKNNNGIIEEDEFYNFDFQTLVKEEDKATSVYKDFNLLTFLPVKNDIYFYFYSSTELNKTTLQVAYSDSQNVNEDTSLGYIENNKLKDLVYLNRYNVENGYFFKFKLENFSDNYIENSNLQNRIRIFDFVMLKDNQKITYDYSASDPEMWFIGDDFLEDHYLYFKNEAYYYTGKLATALGVIESEDYFPKINGFAYENTAKESTIKEAKEITYFFVDFEDSLELKDLISCEVEYYKLSYDYVRYAKVQSQDTVFVSWDWSKNQDNQYGDIYAGKYQSEDGTLEESINLIGKKTKLNNYNENVLVFNAAGEAEEVNLNYQDYLALTDNSGNKDTKIWSSAGNTTITETFYNPDLSNLENGFENVEILNNGKPYHKTILSDYNESDFTYEQINVASSYWSHMPYKRTYNFKPIINLKTYEEDLVGTEYDLAKNFFSESLTNLSDSNFNPEFAILIDGTSLDSDCNRSIEHTEIINVHEERNTTSVISSATYNDLIKSTTHCHEIYNAQLLKCVARKNNGEQITFSAIGNPAYLEFITFTGYQAPTLVNYILNDVSSWWSSILDQLGNWIYLIAIILAIILIAIISPVLVPIIKFILKIIAWPFKTIYKAIKKNK